LHSRSAQIKKTVASQLRAALKDVGASSTGFHLPGVLNVHTDRPSRAGEALYARLTPSVRLVQFARAMLQRLRGTQLLEAYGTASFPSAPNRGHVWVIVPAPQDREACIRQTLESGFKDEIVLALPEADYSDNRWSPIMRKLSRLASIPPMIPLYESPQSASHVLWQCDICVSRQQIGNWNVWIVA
jgi:hypothetical protein